jgi:hypothetical protein
MNIRNWNQGKKFGRLSLVERSGTRDGRQLWICNCDCGTKGIEVRADKLSDGRKKSCGCLVSEAYERYRPIREQAQKDRDRVLKLRIDKKGRQVCDRIEERHALVRSILLSSHASKNEPLWRPKYYAELVLDDECYYCKGPLNQKSPSLDLKQGSYIQYRAYNVVPACKFCMEMRAISSLTFEEMEILSPALELIRQRKETNEHGANS